MNRRDYESLKEHIDARLREAQAAHQRDMEALERTWAVSQEVTQKIGTQLGESKPVIADLIKAVLPTLGKEFKKYEIAAAIEKRFPETKGMFRASSLAATVSRLAKRHQQIEIIQKGPGPEGHVYRRIE